ncbi:hypothetical protein BCY86_05710 [Pajaroellobacter abortibovis]|uniref:Uncharacterized protein n=1 Tax=Pajaroellobacter abortibovis TaxID=1882918 RepID=A0A1L6MXD7_9BACT|nr:hypothetical protein BCY86_05710 [Pajaroellobacter abortibovis]
MDLAFPLDRRKPKFSFGKAALLYQSVLNKCFRLLLGVNGYATAAITVTFILGLAIGSVLDGWLASKQNKWHPLWYGGSGL